MPPRTKLIVADVDGTIVGSDGVHASTWDAMDDARRVGVSIALCTGRIPAGEAVELATRTDADQLHIFCSGAVITAPNQPSVYTSELPEAAATALTDLSRKVGLPIELCTQRGFSVEWHSRLTELHADRLGIAALVTDADRVVQPMIGAVWALHDHEWPLVREATERLHGTTTTVARVPWAPEAVFANITRSGTSKGAALRWLRRHRRLRRVEVVMVGDGDNDVDAFAEAGTAIAMADGSTAAVRAAHHIVAPSSKGGFADAVHLALELGGDHDPTPRPR
jgi:HAD superfamily hydrolase (TIGR01484 family)